MVLGVVGTRRLTPVLGVMTAIVVLSDASDLVGAISAIVTGLSSIPAELFPDDRKRTGNKVLAAKAANLLERVKNRDDELSLAGTTPYQLLRQFRYELGVLARRRRPSPPSFRSGSFHRPLRSCRPGLKASNDDLDASSAGNAALPGSGAGGHDPNGGRVVRRKLLRRGLQSGTDRFVVLGEVGLEQFG